MGSALIMMTVPEEALAQVHEGVKPIPGINWLGQFVRGEKPEPYYLFKVPVSAVWRLPEEPRAVTVDRCAAAVRAHRAAVERSLERFVNGKLRQLDGMVRTGWWILSAARVKVTRLIGKR